MEKRGWDLGRFPTKVRSSATLLALSLHFSRGLREISELGMGGVMDGMVDWTGNRCRMSYGFVLGYLAGGVSLCVFCVLETGGFEDW